jgi:cation/acetate symporter
MGIFLFLIIIIGTVGLTIVASKRTSSAADFFVAGGKIGGLSNGFAIAGDFMSAATLLGITAIIFGAGYDAVIYLGAPLGAFSIVIYLMSDKLKALGKYSFTDIICTRLKQKPIRILAATTTLSFSLMYLMVQIVGAGALIEVLFGISYIWSVIIVTALMVIYVAVGGMLATTWVQITKAILLLVGVTVLALLTLASFDFSFSSMYEAAQSNHGTDGLLTKAGGLGLTSLSAVSLGIGLCLGLAGSPHLLMRFFTVKDKASARVSAGVALGAISYVNILIFFVIGVGSVALVKGNPAYLDSTGGIIGGSNMVSVHLADAVGGEIFLGIIAAIAFATILAVVAGLMLASVTALTHDIYTNVIMKGEVDQQKQIRLSKYAAVALGIAVALLGIAFERQNIAYLVSLTLAIGASTNFPLLILSMYWQGLTTKGAVTGGVIGLVAAILLMVLGPAVWVDVLGNEQPVFPQAYPALFSVSLAFFTMWLVSIFDQSEQAAEDRSKFEIMKAA